MLQYITPSAFILPGLPGRSRRFGALAPSGRDAIEQLVLGAATVAEGVTSITAGGWIPFSGRLSQGRRGGGRVAPVPLPGVTFSRSPKPPTPFPSTAVFLRVLCREIGPAAVLDLGSGFSSFVLRSYDDGGGARVTSVDDSETWLARTAQFLESRGVPTDQLLLPGRVPQRTSGSATI